MFPLRARLQRGGDLVGELHRAGGEAPLVVVPREDLDLAVQHGGQLRVEDRGDLLADDVGGDDRVLGVLENALELALGGLRDGERVDSNFFGQSSFATYAIATERNVVKVDDDAPLELLGPLGCGLSTGAGAIINSLKVNAGASVGVFGTGAVGSAASRARTTWT